MMSAYSDFKRLIDIVRVMEECEDSDEVNEEERNMASGTGASSRRQYSSRHSKPESKEEHIKRLQEEIDRLTADSGSSSKY